MSVCGAVIHSLSGSQPYCICVLLAAVFAEEAFVAVVVEGDASVCIADVG